MNTNVTCVDVDENELRSPSPNKKSKKQVRNFKKEIDFDVIEFFKKISYSS